MKSKDLILIGGGGHCKSVIDAAESAGFNIIGILDTIEKVGSKVLQYPIIGTDDDIYEYTDRANFIVTVGQIKSAELRIKLQQKVKEVNGQLTTVIAPTAHISRYAQIGEGSVIMHHAVINAEAHIGMGCIINTFANIEHDVVIHDFCHISTGAMINGNCTVYQETFVGSQSVMANGTSICTGCVISAGSVIRKSIIQKGIYSGNPATLKIQLP